ncbi:MAG: hypothetical protein IPN97_16305 [Saprospiraceae bacterium]|nr:hypothetical protein [Saprospiraceae bacterium]
MSAQEAYGRIESKLHSLDMLTLLFTKNLKKIRWQTTGKNGEYIRSDVRNKNYRITTISVKGKQSSFFVFSKDIVWELNSYKPVDIALQINKNGEFDPVSRSLFVLFPTILDTRLKFILNGPFRTKPSRESISYDDKFNQNIISTACQLFQDILIILKSEGRIDDRFLNLLPINSDEVIDFFIPLQNTINTIFKTEPYIPTNNQKYNTLENIRYVSPKRLSDFFSREDIVVLEENSNIEVLKPISKNSRAFEFLSSLGLIDWSWKELEDNLSNLFKEKVYIDKLEDQDLNKDAYQWILSKSDDWLIQFYTLLSEGVEGGKIGTEDFIYSTYDTERKLSSVFIIKCEEFDDFYFDDAPSTKFPKDGYTGVIFKGFLEKTEDEIPKIKKMFQSLGVKELSESDEITILLRENYDTIYSTSSSKNIDSADHLEHLQKFKNFYKNNKRTTIFQNYKLLLAENLLITSPSLVFVDNNFLSTGLSILFSLEIEIYSKKFRIWNGYEEIFDEDLLKFWEELGVYTSLKIASQVIYMNPRWNDLRAGMYGNDGSPYKVEKDYVIPNLEKILLSNNLEVIKLLWTTMDGLDSEFFTAKYRINSNYRTKEVPSYLIHILSSHYWIPTADLEYKHPHDITFEELHGELKILTKNIGWLDKIELGKNKRKEIEQYNQKKEILEEFIDPDDYSSYLEFKKISGNKPLSFIVDLFRPSQLLPERPISNHEKRRQIVLTKFNEAEAINFNPEIRNTRVTKSKLDKVIKNYLREHYTNVNNSMICQICFGFNAL